MNDPNTLIAFSVSDAAIATLAAKYLEQLRPDKEKLERFADSIQNLDVPTLATAKVAAAVATLLAGTAGKIREIAAGLE